MFEQRIVKGDTWNKGSSTVVIKGYTKDGSGFVIYSFGVLSQDVRVLTEYEFRRDFNFLYRDPKRKLTIKDKFRKWFNGLLENLYIE